MINEEISDYHEIEILEDGQSDAQNNDEDVVKEENANEEGKGGKEEDEDTLKELTADDMIFSKFQQYK